MQNNKSKKSIEIAGYIAAFLIPAIIISGAFVLLDIYPGGKYTPLILDLGSEHLPFFNYLNNISGINSLFYQSFGGLGSGTINSLQMYTGPFVFVSALFNIRYIPYVIWGMILFQIGLCGLTEYFYLKNGYPCLGGIYKPLFLSFFYSLMNCAVIYTIVPVWLWGIVFLPLVMYGIDNIVDYGQSGKFICFLSLSILFNYLTAYIIIIFSLIYFIYRILTDDISAKKFRFILSKYFFGGVIAVAITDVSWMPVLCDLIVGKAEENRNPRLGIVRNPIYVIGCLVNPGYDGLSRYSLPSVFCGFIPLIMMMVFFLNRNISVRKKIISISVMIVFILSFSIGIFDIAWMFFAEPNGYPSRYSFVFSFIIILLAADGLKSINKSILDNYFFRILLFVIAFAGCVIRSAYLLEHIRDDVGPYSEYSEYIRVCDTMDNIISEYNIDSGFCRAVKNWRLTNNDGILFGYSDIDYFSSSYNSKFHEFMKALGLNTQFHLLRSEGLTPVVASVFGVTYCIEYKTYMGDYYDYVGIVDDLDIYENRNAVPMVFAVETDDLSFAADYSDNPFTNINDLLYDISGVKGVFDELDHTFGNGVATVYVDEGCDLWMYADADGYSGGDIHGTDSDETQYVYYDEVPIKAFNNYISSYCVSLGFGAGDYASFSFDDASSIKSIYFASMNVDKTDEALSVIRNNAAHDFKEIGNGFICEISVNRDKYVILTLPFDRGIKIVDNGKVLDIDPYMGALVCFRLEEGDHVIEVRYVPEGLKPGLCISAIACFCILLCIMLPLITGKNIKIKRSENEI